MQRILRNEAFFPGCFSRVGAPNCTEFANDIGSSSMLTEFVLYFRYLLNLETRTAQTLAVSKIEAKSCTFWRSVKLRETNEIGEMTELTIHYTVHI